MEIIHDILREFNEKKVLLSNVLDLYRRKILRLWTGMMVVPMPTILPPDTGALLIDKARREYLIGRPSLP